MSIAEDLSGRRFGKWVVIKLHSITKTHDRIWVCKCGCGNIRNVRSGHLKAGRSSKCQSCAGLDKKKAKLNKDILDIEALLDTEGFDD